MNRKIKMMLTVLIIACGFTACWDAEQNKISAKGVKQNENSSVVMELLAVSDTMTEIIQTTTISLDGYDQKALDQIDEQITDTKQRYDGITGVNCSYARSQSQITEIIKIDLKQADLSQLAENGILCLDGNHENGLSFSNSIEHLNTLGFSFD